MALVKCCLFFCIIVVFVTADKQCHLNYADNVFVPVEVIRGSSMQAANGTVIDQLMDILPTPFRLLPMHSPSSACHYHSRLLLEQARKSQTWALSLLDSWGRMPAGVLRGNINQLGDFDQCVRTKGEEGIRGRYCLATLDVQLPPHLRELNDLLHSHRVISSNITDPGHRVPHFSLIHWAICIPESCSAPDLETNLRSKLARSADATTGFAVQVSVEPHMCHAENDPRPGEDGARMLTVLFFTLVAAVCFFATVTEGSTNRKRKHGRVLECFSLRRTWAELLCRTIAPDELAPLHGIRALNILGLLLSHKQMALFFTPYVNRTILAQTVGMAWSTIGRTAILYTDSFILISGLLTARTFLKQLDVNRRLSLVNTYRDRLIRLTPNLAAMVLFCTSILPSLSSGPQWNLVVTKYARLCETNWWRNFLYIHNYFGFETMCLTHTHQLGIDMQLFAVAPIAVYGLWRWPRGGTVAIFLVASASTLLRYVVTLENNLSTIVYFGISISQMFATANLSYILPTHRATVYIIGISLAFFLHRQKEPLVMSKLAVALGWLVALGCGIAAMFGPYRMAIIGYKYNAMDAALYNAFAPIVWSAFIVWLVLASLYGYAGWFGTFLSWKWFIVLTRISYAVYLTQFPIFFFNVGRNRVSQYYSQMLMFDIPEFGAILLASVVLTLTFDLPFQNLKRLLWSTSKPHGSASVNATATMNIQHNGDGRQPEPSVNLLHRKLIRRSG